jgi:soluble cytochrome b562
VNKLEFSKEMRRLKQLASELEKERNIMVKERDLEAPASKLSFSINVEDLKDFEEKIQHVMSLIDDLNRRAAACEKQVQAAIAAIDRIGYTVTQPKAPSV